MPSKQIIRTTRRVRAVPSRAPHYGRPVRQALVEMDSSGYAVSAPRRARRESQELFSGDFRYLQALSFDGSASRSTRSMLSVWFSLPTTQGGRLMLAARKKRSSSQLVGCLDHASAVEFLMISSPVNTVPFYSQDWGMMVASLLMIVPALWCVTIESPL